MIELTSAPMRATTALEEDVASSAQLHLPRVQIQDTPERRRTFLCSATIAIMVAGSAAEDNLAVPKASLPRGSAAS
ncbi:uncharacterized protein P884DRAFT_26342 [Thermothelomyces heterothallicus CBS 202.75]|uniref:uncharacterized protein n=1 Tax=Thermothelomyces heterothallicus CBS 202.75 TaxID=1149848 RepID=UPI0037425BB3